ncbi:MAG: PqiB family protein, partial [Gammaproteobacteria bacterium]
MDNLEPAKPVVSRRRGISAVWIIPLVATAIGIWLLIYTLNQKGPTVEIQFESADGLEAGKTKIKLRNVVVGSVAKIALGDDPSYVVVTAEIQKDAERFIKADTAFWVVRPRIQGANVSGLGTLVSGAYISILPGASERSATQFVALDSPPLIEDEALGKHLILEAERRGSLTPGSPVYLRDLEVGEVTSITLVENNRYMEIGIFIRDPYDETVLSTTRFWNASGVDFSIGAEGVDVQIASLETLLSGGIAFETLDENGRVPPENARFRLYASRKQIDEFSFKEKIRYVLYFGDSVRGLSVDAPVEFRGIKIGRVTRINAEFDPTDATV